jgi:hypothetical protein
MTQTLTTERLREIASSPSFSANPLSHEVKYMARELLANRVAQPSITDEAIDRIVIPLIPEGLDEEKHHCEWNLYQDRERIRKALREYFSAPPAPAVVNGRTAEGWMAEALLQKKIADGLRKSAPAVPSAISTRQAIVKMETHEPCDSVNVAYKLGWNACRAAMLAVAREGGK